MDFLQLRTERSSEAVCLPSYPIQRPTGWLAGFSFQPWLHTRLPALGAEPSFILAKFVSVANLVQQTVG